jgi:hypothetical protein
MRESCVNSSGVAFHLFPPIRGRGAFVQGKISLYGGHNIHVAFVNEQMPLVRRDAQRKSVTRHRAILRPSPNCLDTEARNLARSISMKIEPVIQGDGLLHGRLASWLVVVGSGSVQDHKHHCKFFVELFDKKVNVPAEVLIAVP